MKIELIPEYQLLSSTKQQLSLLLQQCFPTGKFFGRPYFKQLPNQRLLMWDDEKLVGHVGIDYRVMSLNGQPIQVFGVKSLCVDTKYRGRGYGVKLMQEFERIALQYSENIDFLFLVTDIPEFYEGLGYKSADIKIKWLKINQHQTIGIGSEKIDDSYFMYKAISGKIWEDGELDMLGYMY